MQTLLNCPDGGFDEGLVVRNRRRGLGVRGGVRQLDDSDARGEHLQAQVRVLDYQSDDDFVLQLAAADSQDAIMLAKVKPAKTLAETVEGVRRRISIPDATNAETYFERALTVARQQHAKSWELRAAAGGTLKSCFGPWSESLRSNYGRPCR